MDVICSNIKDIINAEHEKISAIATQEIPNPTDDKDKWTSYIRKAVAAVPGTGFTDEIHVVLCTISQDPRVISGKRDILVMIVRSKESIGTESTVIYDELPILTPDGFSCNHCNTRKRTEKYRTVCDIDNSWHECVTNIAKEVASITLLFRKIKH